MLKCNKCGVEKPESDFNFNKSKGRLEVHCKLCHKQYMHDHYVRRKQYYVDKAKTRNAECALLNRKKAWEFLQSHPCVDCGEKEVIFLEFDHVRGDKKHDVSNMLRRGYKWETIQEEIDKCEIRCVKCHRVKTYRQFGWMPFGCDG